MGTQDGNRPRKFWRRYDDAHWPSLKIEECVKKINGYRQHGYLRIE